MKGIWRWIIIIVVGLAIVGLLLAGSSSRRAYRLARGGINARVEFTQDRIDTVEQIATTAVDLALKMTAELPAQQAKADLVKQGIEKVSSLLKEAADLRGQAAVDKLDQAIEAFNAVLKTVEEASSQADNPAVKAKLDQIYGVLVTVQEQLTQFLFTGKQ